jgi:hypothetical protein
MRIALRDSAGIESDPIEEDMTVGIINWLSQDTKIGDAIINMEFDAIDHLSKAIDGFNEPTLDDIQSAVDKVMDEIAKYLGYDSFYGHGNYSVTASDRAGLTVTVYDITPVRFRISFDVDIDTYIGDTPGDVEERMWDMLDELIGQISKEEIDMYQAFAPYRVYDEE